MGGASIFNTSSSTYGFGARLTYTYDTLAAVPEPGTWAMLLAGVTAVGAVVRRRGGVPDGRA